MLKRDSMDNRPLYMRHSLELSTNYPLPPGYQFRLYDDESDNEVWAEILTSTAEFASKNLALERFEQEFLPWLPLMKKRVIFLETEEGKAIGTASAWFGEFNKIDMGRLHWVEIKPEFQGNKLGRPLITKAMTLLKDYHQTAYLKTQASSEAVIHLYQKLGWQHVITTETERHI